MLQGELRTRGLLHGELTGGVFEGTNDYTELINKPSINSVELNGNKTTSDLGIIIPTATSELTNDSGFITSADVPTATSQLTNDSGFITSADVPTATSQLTNDSGFVTSSDLATVATTGNYNDLINKPTIPTKTSDIYNDSGYVTTLELAPVAITGDYDDLIDKPVLATVATTGDYDDLLNKPTIPTATSELLNDSGFLSFTEVTDTLTAGQTSITLLDASITTTSTIDIYTDVFGIQPTNEVVTSGSITLTFLAQASDISVKVRVS